MKALSRRLLASVALFASGFLFMGAPTHAATMITESAEYTPDAIIPDASLSGIVDSRSFLSTITEITSLRVALWIEGRPASEDAFNGDFYAYLTHATGFVVLLNRAGRTATSTFGYADSGINVTFSSVPGLADIHEYGATTYPNSGPITGEWAADGRAVHPALSIDATPRTALLSSFENLDPNGNWTLFVADASAGGTGRLKCWKLEITGPSPIPEASVGVLCLLFASVVVGRRRK